MSNLLAEHPRVRKLLRWSHQKTRVSSTTGSVSDFWHTEACQAPTQFEANRGMKPATHVVGQTKGDHLCLPISEIVTALQRALDSEGVGVYKVRTVRRMCGSGLAGLTMSIVWADRTSSTLPALGDLGHEISVNVSWDNKARLSISRYITRLACLNGMFVMVTDDVMLKRHTVGNLSPDAHTIECLSGQEAPSYKEFHTAFNTAVGLDTYESTTRNVDYQIRLLESESKTPLTSNGFAALVGYSLSGRWNSSGEYYQAANECYVDDKPKSELASTSQCRKDTRMIAELKKEWLKSLPFTGEFGSDFDAEGGNSMLGVRNCVTWALNSGLKLTGMDTGSRFSETLSNGRSDRAKVYVRMDTAKTVLDSRRRSEFDQDLKVPDQETAETVCIQYGTSLN